MHVWITHTRAAAVIDLRNMEKLNRDHYSITRLLSSKNVLLGNGCHLVYAYLYVKKGAHVSAPLKSQVENEDIKIIKEDEMSPDELVLKIDEKLQRAPDPNTESGATKTFVDSEGFEDTNLLTAPGNLNFEPL